MKKSILLCLLSMFALCAHAQWYINLERTDFPHCAKRNHPFAMSFSITNNSQDAIDRIEVQYKPNGGTAMSVPYKFDSPVAAGAEAQFTIDGFTCDVAGMEVYGDFTITTVNGSTNYGSGTYLYLFCADELVKRRLVVEEGASVNCGYCPRGYETIEQMREKYTDGTWIGISIQRDGIMSDSNTFSTFWNKVSGIPTCFVNRNYENAISPMPLTLDDIYSNAMKESAVVAVEATAEPSAADNNVLVETTVRFVLDFTDADFQIAYIITEDNLGPYTQRNYFSGNSLGEFYGWENKPSYVSVVYNDIARKGSIYDGISGLIPSDIVAGKEYTVRQTIDLSAVSEYDNAKIAILIIDGSTGKIANAVRIPITQSGAGIDGIEADSNRCSITGQKGQISITSAHRGSIYNITGLKLADFDGTCTMPFSPGMYIVTCGNHSHKVMVR